MIIDRKQISWALFTVIATLAAGALYLAAFHPERLPFKLHLPPMLQGGSGLSARSVGGTPVGVFFGTLAALIFVFAALLGARRKRPTLKVGRLQLWLKAHVWFSILTIPLIALHSGFSTGGAMTQVFLALYAVVMLSGFYGLALQQFIPRLMKERVPLETIFEQIPHILAQFRDAAQEMRKSLEPAPAPAATATAPVAVAAEAASTATAVVEPPATTTAPPPDQALLTLQKFLEEEAIPYLSARRGEKHVLGPQRNSDEQFRLVKISVGPEHHEKVEKLQGWCDERRQLDLQTKLQHWLHGWLLVHIPFSLLLLAFTAWHIIAALFFY